MYTFRHEVRACLAFFLLGRLRVLDFFLSSKHREIWASTCAFEQLRDLDFSMTLSLIRG